MVIWYKIFISLKAEFGVEALYMETIQKIRRKYFRNIFGQLS